MTAYLTFKALEKINPTFSSAVLSRLPSQVLIVSVLACIRMYSRYRRVRPLTREVLARDPYSLRGVRKLIDGCAFRIYGHWVKKGEQQNRAALFQNTAKIMLLGLEDFET